ncbi:succinylglutamate desuccinylase [Pseudomonas duriflava]|uniref:Succinylglutamate desuccinylase n=1 Tax=Pseudomonas duriflava TaxID=459528 RepID=A0A562Q8K9_9PSED|nr:succinylglutamate desuccinylase [Pseudomonas duriflava]TWI53073.1 succinylglutamate desuccinylase [Pseudomonas duriflava]
MTEQYGLSLGKLLELTLAGREPAEKIQLTSSGTRLQWLEEGALLVKPAASEDTGFDVLLSAGIHGNETAPIELVDRLLKSIARGEIKPRVRILFLLGNPEAMRRNVRFVEQDMNRLFNGRHALMSGFEAQRADQLERLVSQFFSEPKRARLHYDLHTAIRGSAIERFALYPWSEGRTHSQAEMARLEAAGIDAILLQSKPGITFSAYSYAAHEAEAFTLELGKARPFGQNAGVDLSKLESGLRALIEQREPPRPEKPEHLRVFRVSREIIKHSDNFKLHLADDVANFTALPEGYLLAEDGVHQWIVTETDARIIFPNPHVKPGLRAGILIVPCTPAGQAVLS